MTRHRSQSDPRRNIVICLDGTGNQIEENISNVLKLYRVLRKTDDQIVYYDQGVGTLGQTSRWGRWTQTLRSVVGLATGMGLDDNVLRAYGFLVRHHRMHKIDGKTRKRGDHIYIFGYSRGAHTARVLAGLIYEIGILQPEQIHLAGAALTAYKATNRPLGTSDTQGRIQYEGEGANFRRITHGAVGRIRFLGLWDTVSSVLIPNPHGLFPPLIRETLPHTRSNPAVRTVRHALAIDERRRMFRPDRWTSGPYKPNLYSQGEPPQQDVREVWFAGVHGDVGGGYARAKSGLSQIPLIWMLEEAKAAGLSVRTRMMEYVTGQKAWSETTRYLYPAPDPAATVHTSLTAGWWPLEIFPKAARFRNWPKRKLWFGWVYIPWAEPRFIAPDDDIHPSVRERVELKPDYRPINLPDASPPL